MAARTGTASLTGASGRITGCEEVSPGTWVEAAGSGSGSGCAGARAVAFAGALRTGAVAGVISGPSGIGTNAGTDTGTDGRGGAVCCSGGGGGYGGDVSGPCEPAPMGVAGCGTAGVAATGERRVVTTTGADGAAGTGA